MKKLNVILDIDETFVQYGGIDDWKLLTPEQQAKYEHISVGSKGVFIMRPHTHEFFDFLRDNCATINLWTWSDYEYAKGLANSLNTLGGWNIANIWADSDVDASIELHGKNKDLNYIWYTKKKFKPCDTILVDDLKANAINASNVKNAINLKAFEPLGHRLPKRDARNSPTRIREGPSGDFSTDDTLLKVMETIRGVVNNPDFCKEGDMPFPFPNAKVGGKRKTRRRRTLRKRF